MECKKCQGDLYCIEGLSSEPEGIRNDVYCPDCHIHYMSTKAMLEVVHDPVAKQTSGFAMGERECQIWQDVYARVMIEMLKMKIKEGFENSNCIKGSEERRILSDVCTILADIALEDYRKKVESEA